jgi:hypothetical protein
MNEIELKATLHYLTKNYNRNGNSTYIPDIEKREENITLYSLIKKISELLEV